MKKILRIYAIVRFWEDGLLNDKPDDPVKPKMPCINIYENEKAWCPIINVITGQIINWTIGNYADINYKVCDLCYIDYFEDDEIICNNEVERYCPLFLSPDENNFGDYITIKIDKNGYIKNWDINLVEAWIKRQPKLSKKTIIRNQDTNYNIFNSLINELIPINKPEIIKTDKQFDINSNEKIWKSGKVKHIGFLTESLPNLLKLIKQLMDSVITEHPHLTYDDLKFSCEVNHENDDIGLLTCSYEWEETDEEFIERQNRIKEEQEQEFN